MSIISKLISKEPDYSNEAYLIQFLSAMSAVLAESTDDTIKAKYSADVIFDVAQHDQTYPENMRLLRIAAEMGHWAAAYIYQLHLSEGAVTSGINEDSDLFYAQKIGAEAGELTCMYNLAISYSLLDDAELPFGLEERDEKVCMSPNFQKAFHWFYQCALKGDQESIIRVIRYYMFGLGTEPSMDKAVFWLTRMEDMEAIRSLPEHVQNLYNEQLEIMMRESDLLKNGSVNKLNATTRAATAGEPTAMAVLALHQKDVPTILRLLHEGNIEAARVYPSLLNMEDVTWEKEPSMDDLLKSMELLAKEGDMDTYRYLAKYYYEEKQDTDRAIQYLKSALLVETEGNQVIAKKVCTALAEITAPLIYYAMDGLLVFYYYCKCGGIENDGNQEFWDDCRKTNFKKLNAALATS